MEARHRLRDAGQGEPEADLRQHFRLRAGRALSRPRGVRPDRPGDGRADGGDRTAGARSRACGHSGRRPERRPVRGARRAHRFAGAEPLRPGAVGAELIALRDGHDDGLPGCALADGRRGPRAGRQRSPHVDADRRLSDCRRFRQRCGSRKGHLHAPVRGAGRARAGDPSRFCHRRAALDQSCGAQPDPRRAHAAA